MVHPDFIFLFMMISCPENLIHQFSIIGHKDQPFRIFIQPAHRVNSLRIMKEIHDVIFFFFLGGANDPFWLIHRQQHPFAADFKLGAHFFSIHTYFLSRFYLLPQFGRDTVDQDTSFFHIAIRLPPGTDSGVTEIFIQPDRDVRLCFFFYFILILHFYSASNLASAFC